MQLSVGATPALGLLIGLALAPHAPQEVRAADGTTRERVERDIRRLVEFGTRHSLSSVDDPLRGVGAARRWLAEEFERISARYHGGRLVVESVAHRVSSSERAPSGGEIVNVMATLPGRQRERLVIVSGHYDSRASDPLDAVADAPGANDDASGVAVVLECARALSGIQPRATIVFMALAGEEQSLLGSTVQAQACKDAGLEVEAFLTNDIVGGARGSNGRLEPGRLRLFSEGQTSGGRRVVASESDAPSRQLARFLEAVIESDQPDFDVDLIFRQDRYLRGGDHKPFNKQGFAAVRFSEPNENYDFQHQDVRSVDGKPYGDLPEYVDFDYVARVARANSVGVAALALGPQSVREVKLDVKKLSPDTRITWKLAAPEEVASYAVRMRRTDEARWRPALEVGYAGEVVLEGVCKDDWLFALEARDAQGRTSVPSLAE